MIRDIKSNIIKRPGHVACMVNKGNVYRILEGNPEG
jgi:hypothetical protein